MKFSEYQNTIGRLGYGKCLPEAVYIIRPDTLDPENLLHAIILRAAAAAQPPGDWNLLKLHKKEFSISFLVYPAFDKDPHPSLAGSTKINLNSGRIVRTDYSKRANPPILHRKESFLPPDDPRFPCFSALTKAEEEAGLYRDLSRIGLRLHWDSLLRNKGLRHEGHQLVRRSGPVPTQSLPEVQVARHRTAIKRYDLSKPIKLLLKHGLLRPGLSLFDYGCGHGMDIEGLGSLGYEVSGWDPAFAPDREKRSADLVNLGYVLNVIEKPQERIEAIKQAFALCKSALIVSVLPRGQETPAHIRTLGDGFITKSGTFQKFYAPGELEDLLEIQTGTEAVTLALGIVIVFRSEADREDFLSRRTRRRLDWTSLQTQLKFSAPSAREEHLVGKYELHKELLDAFWDCVLDLGRPPEAWEFARWSELSKIGGGRRALQLLLQKFGDEALKKARDLRKEDLLVYLAMKQFEPRFLRKHLTPRSRQDIKVFFGSFDQGKQRSLQLLYASGDPDELHLAIQDLSIGHYDSDEHHFSFHRSLLDDLPGILRVYVYCGLRRFGDLEETDLIKIHLKSGKLTLHQYDDFQTNNLPELQLRIKIDLRKDFVSVFDHTLGPDRQLLFFKERFVKDDFPTLPKAQKFSQRLRKLGLSEETIGYGPTKAEFLEMASAAGLTPSLVPRKSQN